jgi:phosphoribosylanthranilate isomerase
VKICGLTRVEDARSAVLLGADAIGLNFWSGSKRRCDVEVARAIARALPPFCASVGVFVNQPADEIRAVAERVGLSMIQLHGDEPPEACEGLGRPVIKAIRVEGDDWAARALRYATHGLLLDAPSPGYGGSGRTFAWREAHALAHARAVIVAGGLTPENVGEAIRVVRPYAVDVASGVESAPGEKDLEKMLRFMQAVEEAGS